MKVAELHNGNRLEFPPETPDEIVDQAVQAHLQQNAPPEEPNPVAEEMDAVSEALIELLPLTAAAMARSQKQTQEKSVEEINATLQSVAVVLVEALNKSGTSEAILKNAMVLNQISQRLAHLPESVKAINNLSATIAEVGSLILAFLSKERKILRSPDGSPDGIVVRSQKE